MSFPARNRLQGIVGILAIQCAVSVFCPVSTATASPHTAPATVEIIVGKKTGISHQQNKQLLKESGAVYARPVAFLKNAQVLRVEKDKLTATMAILHRNQMVKWVDVNRTVHAYTADSPLVNDPLFSNQWALNNTKNTGADLDAALAWKYSTGVGATVGIIDSGLLADQADLQGQILDQLNTQEMPGNGVDDDHNGLVDDYNGWDWVDQDSIPTDLNGHGTHVAGIIDALQNNGLGISGIAPGSKVAPLRVLDNSGTGKVEDIASALGYAGVMGLRVANLSLGASSAPPSSWIQAVQDHPNTLYVTSAGNSNKRLSSSPSHGDQSAPCNIQAANVLCVGATGWGSSSYASQCPAWESAANDCVASYSNYGGPVAVYAPGSQIISTWSTGFLPSSDYMELSGTSMAAPYVSGLAALIFSVHPDWTAAQVKQKIISSADHTVLNTKVASDDPARTGLRINAGAALSGAPDPEHDGLIDTSDNCPSSYNPDQEDRDGDGVGDACDQTPNGPDLDADKLGALVDNCPTVYNPNQADLDRDGTGDVCDSDMDGDGFINNQDNCPRVTNPVQADANHNKTGDACDPHLVFRWSRSARLSGKNSLWSGWGNASGRLSITIQSLHKGRWGNYRIKSMRVSAGNISLSYGLGRGTWRLAARLDNSIGSSGLIVSPAWIVRH